METRVYVPDIECDSCIKLIHRQLSRLQGIESYKNTAEYVDVDHDDTLIRPDNIVNAIKESGFRASLEPFERKNLKERIKHFRENKPHYALEIQAARYALYGFFLLIGLQAIAYFGFLSKIPGFLGNYGWWILYLDISMATLGAATWHFYSHKAKVTCMVGMMIGMTIGMQSGMMLGAVIGATNGFFVGAMAGMLLGTAVGAITGKCCGVMGIMEGMMAGLMGGTMGPMITVMMFSDNVLLFMPFYMLINVAIIVGLTYMVLEEVAEGKIGVKRRPADMVTYMSLLVIAGFVLTALMIYGPKSALLSF